MTATEIIQKQRADELCSALMEGWKSDLETDNRKFEPAAVYASQRHKCIRKMTLDLVAWDQKPAFEPAALERMRRGKERESDIVARLKHVGKLSSPRFDVIHEQFPAQIKNRNGRVIIRMKMDGRIQFETKESPVVEIKRYHPNIADGIKTVDDFMKTPWTYYAPDQMLAYLLAYEEPWGVFILETSGLPRLIPVHLEDHLERAEAFLKDAEQAMNAKEEYAALGAESLPGFLQGDPAACRRCPHFMRACQPNLDYGPGAYVIDDPEFEAMLEQREKLAPLSAEYARINKEVKERLQGKELAIAGNFQITGRMVEKKGYEVKPASYWQIEIERIK